ncbi:hypothetical protein [Streptomyces sp. NPDC051662]|uniref:hypothetical protein n=1 Tax=Streptomyces sp. NPDC051662 TaxID=3154750 RepID=UPI0034270321
MSTTPTTCSASAHASPDTPGGYPTRERTTTRSSPSASRAGSRRSGTITLSFSRDTGIVAIAHGEQYPWAQTALETAGFQFGDYGTYVLSADDPDTARATVTALVRAAQRHRIIVTTSSRRFLGDIAQDLAAQLPGRWAAALEVYNHPVWQEDLVPWLWDSGELSQAVQTGRVPYAARLGDGADISLLLIERPGHDQG